MIDPAQLFAARLLHLSEAIGDRQLLTHIPQPAEDARFRLVDAQITMLFTIRERYAPELVARCRGDLSPIAPSLQVQVIVDRRPDLKTHRHGGTISGDNDIIRVK